jgi:TonB family protein
MYFTFLENDLVKTKPKSTIKNNCMKNYTLILLSLLWINSGFSQNSTYKFAYFGRVTPAIKKEKLQGVKYISEVMPEFCRNFKLPAPERAQLDKLLKIIEPRKNYFFLLNGYTQLCENYEEIITYSAIEILTTNQGKIHSSKSVTNILTSEQKKNLTDADINTDIRIKIKFNYKSWVVATREQGKIKEGEYAATVIPQTEANYPGGFQALGNYITEQVVNKISIKDAAEKIRKAIVKFTINENGQLVDATLSSSSTDPKIDRLILDAIYKMPAWDPAVDAKGVSVKQEFIIPFREGVKIGVNC